MLGQDIKIITGMSGAGKSEAIQILEDRNYYCVDNLPPNLFPKFLEVAAQAQIGNVALVADIRGRKFFAELQAVLADLRKQNIPFTLIFLEANNEVLVRRFKESRRRHPAGGSLGLLEGIQKERRMLEAVRGAADVVIDTSYLKVKEMRAQLTSLLEQEQSLQFTVSISSFGFKYGMPIDMDVVMDMRFLANPYYVESLRPLTGLDAAIREFVLADSAAVDFLANFSKMLFRLFPLYEAQGKMFLSVGIGCTGGQHRSVVMAEELAARLRQMSLDCYGVSVSHRDLKFAEKVAQGVNA